jgi:plasmid stabilization system protein ParE
VTHQLVVSREAQTDIAEAIAWLRGASPSLPSRFKLELENVYASILEHTQMYPVVHKNIRRALLRRFPYSVFYVVERPIVLIVGVVHHSRDDATWKRRA